MILDNFWLTLFFGILFPAVVAGFMLILFVTSWKQRPRNIEFMSLEDYLRAWLIGHGEGYRVDVAVEEIKHNAFGQVYAPAVYNAGKRLAKLGFTPNRVSYLSVILTLFIFYLTVMAGEGQGLPWFTNQSWFGMILFPTGFLVLYTGINDGADGAVAIFLNMRSKRGAWIDAMLDRVTDILLLACLIPGRFLVYPELGLDLSWLVWINLFMLFLFEYMRAKHFELDLLVIKPLKGERLTRIVLQSAIYMGFGGNSLFSLIAYLINPSVASTPVGAYFTVVIYWIMLVYQVMFFVIMVSSCVASARWIMSELKIMDEQHLDMKTDY
ncbi:MAG TPA: CDP-alcohol phosphatidyltransferase family protein [Candidatus Lokiarchaeia archaeon]|nr:CDP-alcohol phosphatidyltransferase family protein [Candidatus Lokiarchaeia archaeon]